MDRCFLGILIVLPVFAMLIFAVPGKVLAAEEEGILKLDDFGLDEVEESLKELSGSEIFRFTDAVRSLMKGEIPLDFESIRSLISRVLFSEMQNQKTTALQVLLLVIAAAVILNFTDICEKNSTAGVSFYVMYLLLFALLMKAFYGMSQMMETSLEHVTGFMKALIPSYFAASVFAAGSVGGTVFYEFTFVLIGIIQWLMKHALLPGVELYVLFQMLNHLSKDERLSRMAELIRTLIEWTLKTLMAAALGLQAVQSLILPAVDSLKNTAVNRAASSIPGIGTVFGGVTDMVLGSAVLLKNSIGVCGMIAILFICAAPVCRLALCALLYRTMVAVIQPVSDRRLNACVAAVSDGAGLLLKIMLDTGMLFFLTLAMVTASLGK